MLETQEMQDRSLGQEDPLEEEMATLSSVLPGKLHGQRNLTGYSLWGCKESDMTEQLSMHACCMAYMNTAKKVNLQKSHQKEKKAVFYYIYMR